MVRANNQTQGATTETVLFLGAGFSHSVSRGRLPLLSGLLIPDDLRAGTATAEVVARCFGDRVPTFEEVVTHVDPYATSPVCAVAADSQWTETRRRAFVELESLALSRLHLPESFDSRDWVVDWLQRADESTTVITTNYDTLAECILSQRFGPCEHHDSFRCHACRMRALLRQRDSCRAQSVYAPPTHVGALLKLHGSLAWSRCACDDCLGCESIYDDPCADDTASHRCGCCGGECRRVIVPASKAKRFDHMPFLCTMWDAARRSLSEARRLVMFGYSLPESDSAVLDLLAGSLKSGRLEEVTVIDPHAEMLLRRLQRLVGRDLRAATAIADCATENAPGALSVAL